MEFAMSHIFPLGKTTLFLFKLWIAPIFLAYIPCVTNSFIYILFFFRISCIHIHRVLWQRPQHTVPCYLCDIKLEAPP